MNPDEFNEAGEWTGTCEKCQTSHDGYPPDTMCGQITCVEVQVKRLGSVIGDALLTDVTRIRNRVGRLRDEALARFFRS